MAGNREFRDFVLSEEHEALREAVHQLAVDKIVPRASEVDETGEFPWDLYQALVASRFHSPHIPEEYGGEGADALATCLVIEEVARACLSTALIPSVNKLGTLPVMIGGDANICGRYLPAVASGDAMFSYALSEREAGSDAASMRTRAVPGDGGWVLNGQKSWITNAGVSTYYTVMAVTDPDKGPHGISAFVVEKGEPGFAFAEPERKLGIHGSPTRELLFTDCWIPADRIIGEPGTGFRTAMRTLDHTRVTIGAQAIGVAQGALDVATAYAKERIQFGKPISSFQGIQFMLADMAMRIEAARQLVYAAAARSEREDPDLTFFGAAAKCFASDVAMSVTTDAVQVLGGAGYTRDWPVERYMRDAKILQIYEGTNQVQRIVMAKQLLAG